MATSTRAAKVATTTPPPPTPSLWEEVPSEEQLRRLLESCPSRFAREMGLGLLAGAVRAYDGSDVDGLGQLVVNWASTLEAEADPALKRRVRRTHHA